MRPKEITQNIIKQDNEFEEYIHDKMSAIRAQSIKNWRTEDGCSTRLVAENAYRMWGDDAIWTPPSNRIAGLVLCIEAALFLGDDFTKPEWNK